MCSPRQAEFLIESTPMLAFKHRDVLALRAEGFSLDEMASILETDQYQAAHLLCIAEYECIALMMGVIHA